MSANQIEIILSRQLADCLTVPVFLIDPNGELLFYNEPAEELLGKRYEEAGRMSMEEWSTIFNQADHDGNLIPPDELPLVTALKKQQPTHGEFYIKNLEGKKSRISVTAIPIIGRPDRFLGAMAIFWKNKEL